MLFSIEQISYLTLFSIWREAKKDTNNITVLHEVLKHFQINNNNMLDVANEIKPRIDSICKYFKKLWEKHNRSMQKLMENNSDYFSKQFYLPEEIKNKRQTFTNGRKIKLFDESSDCVKRRKRQICGKTIQRVNYPTLPRCHCVHLVTMQQRRL